MDEYSGWENHETDNQIIRPIRVKKKSVNTKYIQYGGLVLVALVYLLFILNKGKESQIISEQSTTFQMSPEQVALQTAHNEVIRTHKELLDVLSKRVATIPLRPNEAGLQQIVNYNIGSDYKRSYGGEILFNSGGSIANQTINLQKRLSDIVDALIIPGTVQGGSAKGPISSATLKVTYSNGENFDISLTSNEIQAIGLMMFEAYISASNGSSTSSYETTVKVKELKEKYLSFLAAVIKFQGLSEGTSAKDIEVATEAYTDSFSTAWTAIPSLVTQMRPSKYLSQGEKKRVVIQKTTEGRNKADEHSTQKKKKL